MKTFLSVVYTVFLWLPLQGAASDIQQKDIYGTVTVASAHCSIASENRGAVDELFRCITAAESKEAIPILLAEISKKTGLPLEPDDVLVSLSIDDAANAGIVKGANDWHRDYWRYSQLTDTNGEQARISGMWPYRWFMHLKEGGAIKIPLWGGAFLAHLTIAPKPERQPFPFHKLMMLNAGFELVGKIIDENIDKLDHHRSIYRDILLCAEEKEERAKKTNAAEMGDSLTDGASDMAMIAFLKEQIGKLSDEILQRKYRLARQAVADRYGIVESD